MRVWPTQARSAGPLGAGSGGRGEGEGWRGTAALWAGVFGVLGDVEGEGGSQRERAHLQPGVGALGMARGLVVEAGRAAAIVVAAV